MSKISKSRTFRKIKKRAISRTTIKYKKKNPHKARCGGCGNVLSGMALRKKIKKSPKTKKRPERTFGGVLCPRCLKEELKKKVRKEND
ncbi:MAG: 50S ribosomal protein L34e [Candidatus Woesearchaeota archaeon]